MRAVIMDLRSGGGVNVYGGGDGVGLDSQRHK